MTIYSIDATFLCCLFPPTAPPVYVIGLAHNELFPYHLTAEENQQSVQVCLEVVGAETLSQTVHITLTTTPNTHGIFTPATGEMPSSLIIVEKNRKKNSNKLFVLQYAVRYKVTGLYMGQVNYHRH